MCQRVEVDGIYVTSPCELAKVIGCEPEQLDGAPTAEWLAEAEKVNGVGNVNWQDACLCGYDIANPLMAVGYWVRITPWGYEAKKIENDKWQMFAAT